jgi:hypothetical protein
LSSVSAHEIEHNLKRSIISKESLLH